MIYSIDEIRQRVNEVSKKHPIDRVYLFGSYALGNATENSDVDLRIDLSEAMGLFKFCGIVNHLEDALNTKVDVLTTRSLDCKFLASIRKNEVLLYEREQ